MVLCTCTETHYKRLQLYLFPGGVTVTEQWNCSSTEELCYHFMLPLFGNGTEKDGQVSWHTGLPFLWHSSFFCALKTSKKILFPTLETKRDNRLCLRGEILFWKKKKKQTIWSLLFLTNFWSHNREVKQAELNKVNKQVSIKHLPAPHYLTCSGPKQQKNQGKLSLDTLW